MPYFASIQYLRGVAALMVLAFHISVIVPNVGWSFPGGAIGVDLFFVISGFVMYISGRDLQPSAFISKRLMRIIPLYWSVTLLVAFVGLNGGVQFGLSVPVEDLVRSLLFIAYENPDALPRVSPIVNQGWSLNIEMMFYAIFAFALAVRPQALLPILSISIISLVIIGFFATRDMPILWFYTKPRLLEFVGGLVLAKLVVEQRFALPRPLAAAMIFIGLAIILSDRLGDASPIISEVMPVILIVAGVLEFEKAIARRPIPFLTLLGDASYSIYLTHVLAIGVMIKVMSMAPGIPPLLQHALMFCICTVVGIVVYIAYERPLGKMLSRWFKARQETKTARAEP